MLWWIEALIHLQLWKEWAECSVWERPCFHHLSLDKHLGVTFMSCSSKLAGNKYNYYPQNMFMSPVGDCIIWALQETDTEWVMLKIKRSIRGQQERKGGEIRSCRKRLKSQCGYDKIIAIKIGELWSKHFPLNVFCFERKYLGLWYPLSKDCPRTVQDGLHLKAEMSCEH